jgi:hypothetical protein
MNVNDVPEITIDDTLIVDDPVDHIVESKIASVSIIEIPSPLELPVPSPEPEYEPEALIFEFEIVNEPIHDVPFTP